MIIALFFIGFILLILNEDNLYNCPRCKHVNTKRSCSKCGTTIGYSDRMSDSSKSVYKAIKHFKR